ncbi:MAG: hypothetical protein KAJ13_09755, partial [Gemmatimonadetes bacterium]|nr:hypothetical protein [Gemmatimonadota bacterium]
MTRRDWRIWIPLLLVAAFPAGLLLGSRLDERESGPADTFPEVSLADAAGDSAVRASAAYSPAAEGPAPPLSAEPAAEGRVQESTGSRRLTPIVQAANRVA